MRAGLLAAMLVCVAVTLATTSHAQRADVIWARQAPGATITLDGVLDEPAWSAAESKIVRYGQNNGNPGSGFKEEGGRLAKDSTYAEARFLVIGNQLYIGVTARDSSVGGGRDFNRFDGLLMSIKDHTSLGFPKPPAEYLYSWWYPDTCDAFPATPGKLPHCLGTFGYPTFPATQCDPRTPAQITAWACSTRVQGISNSDAAVDTGYTIEMRFDLGVLGYNATQAAGETIEFSLSVYDTDWQWPLNLARFSANRSWWENPWGNKANYSQAQIWTKPSVTINSGVAPVVGPEYTMHQGATTINVDGKLLEPVWETADSINIRYDDTALRAGYQGVLKYRSGQFQAPVNGATATVFDPGDLTVKWYFLGDSLYLGYDVRDQYVQYVNLIDRYDGVITSINDRLIRTTDRALAGRRIGFHIGPGGTGVADDYLITLRDSLSAKFALSLKSATTVDTTGNDTDQGYQAEIKIDLTKMGYPHGLGDRVLYAGFDLQDGDSFGVPATASYGTRTWFGREYQDECCPAYVYMGGGGVTGVVPEDGLIRSGFQLLGNAPNPFASSTLIRFALERPSRVSIEVFDLAGRKVSSHDFGLQAERVGQLPFSQTGLKAGLYLYRVKAVEPSTGKVSATGSGKMMVLQ